MAIYNNEALREASIVLNSFLEDQSNIDFMDKAVDSLIKAFQNGGKVLSCGNGGSMCDAMHFAEELTGRFRKERPPLPALAISDPSHLTCVSNDYGFEFVFSKSVEAFGQAGDVLLAISTSGNSPNIINAVNVAKNKKMTTIALLGKGGGKLKDMVDFPIVVESNTSDRIQEIHIKVIHSFIEGVERTLFPENY